MPPPVDLSRFDAETLTNLICFLNYATAEDVARVGHGVSRSFATRLVSTRADAGGAFWTVQDLARAPDLTDRQARALADYVVRLDSARLRMLSPPPVAGNSAEAFVDGPDCLRMLLDEISRASHFVHVQMMLFFSDDVGWEIARALAGRARKGIAVRVMADADVTSSGYSAGSTSVDSAGKADFRAVSAFLREAGAQVIDTSQESYWDWEWDDVRAKLAARGVPPEFLALQDLVQAEVQANWDVADHRKFLVIDGETAVIASLNVGGNYLYPDALDSSGLPSRAGQWHDGCLRVRGPFAEQVNTLFASTWTVRGGDVFDPKDGHRSASSYGDATCALLASFPGNHVNVIRQYFLALADAPAGRVIIENPYINDDSFFDRLAALPPSFATRVTLVNPFTTKASDYPLQGESIRCNMRKPFENGVAFYDYAAGRAMAHWKVAYDEAHGCVCHGSHNLNYRSAVHDFEACALVNSASLSRQVRALLERDLALSRRVTDPGEFYELPAIHLKCAKEELLEYFS